MNSKIVDYISNNDLLFSGCHVLCAVSGGADSMTMLHFLHFHAAALKIKRISVYHLNHNLRGHDSDEDEEYVKTFCEKLSIPFYSDKLSDDSVRCATENSLREERYQRLYEVARKTGADLIATGHTASDLTETVIFNIGRGCGLKGISGIVPKRDIIIRPILCLSRHETEEYCNKNHIHFRTDVSNLSDEYVRNRIRHHIVPPISEIFPDIDDKILVSSSISLEADEYFRKIAREIRSNCVLSLTSINTSQLSSYDSIVVKYVLMDWLQELNIPYDYADIIRLKQLIDTSGRLQLKKGFVVEHFSNSLNLRNNVSEAFVSDLKPGTNDFVHGKKVFVVQDNLRLINKSEDDLSLYDCIDCDKVVGRLVLRNWIYGDTFTSAKRRITKTLKKYFNELKLSSSDKYEQMIISDNVGIVWLEGEGVSSRVLPDQNTKDVYWIKYTI